MDIKSILRKQKYQLIGRHTAAKMCTWARNAVKGGGHCYKQKFYGIESHRCIQMTPCVDCCTHRCMFCWRPIQFTKTEVKNPDNPEEILEQLVKAQNTMLNGYGGAPHDPKKFAEARKPKHIAISLAGEPTLYPYLGEFIRLAHKKGFTTFLVTNGTQPQVLENLDPLPTQLYVTLPAPDEATYLRVCNPIENKWKEIMKTLEILPNLNTRTAIRLTLVKRWNMKNPEKYADLIRRSECDFLEAKGFMCVGFSRFRLSSANMPTFEEVIEFSRKLEQGLGYKIVDSVKPSRVVLLVKDPSRSPLIGNS